MKRLKLFPKIFLYTMSIMLFVVVVTHGLIYLLAPQMQLALSAQDDVVVSIRQEQFVTEAVEKALPISLSCSLLISVVCSLLFSKAIADPIKKISASTEQMMKLDHGANCPIHAKDEIGTLAQNVNDLYSNLLSTIEHLEREKDAVRDMERAKVDFLRAASHELKTPVTALNVTLENMILGVGKYQDYAAYLPECKEMVEQLSGMIHEILETSKLNLTAEPTKQVDVSELLAELCEPYQLIAAAHQITFSLDLPEQFPAVLPVGPFSKAVSNVLANAVAYTEAGKTVAVYMDENRLIIENECVPIPDDEIRRLFEPFYRPDFSRSRESGGNGLGLYIVDTLLTSMNIPYSFAPMKSPPGMCFTIQL
ncbi:sensor histidine kinase [Pseudoflavonifractor sp. 60]|uniref:sensor histidine kinase n=1 Tax=Pseudoflavonifractor sp. 60 TaxID=2304576 RepID=UPI001367DB5D|nr:HAMP domain-containing sensor histidine kinase [Pseudoflavonifractor sp. 60]NBI67295.1 sensor histidine kinase [Pseudoflavonifractor sp. 60]